MVSEVQNNGQNENFKCSLRRSNAVIERSSSRAHACSTAGESSTPARRRRASGAISWQNQDKAEFFRRASQWDTAFTTPKPQRKSSSDPNIEDIGKMTASPTLNTASTSNMRPRDLREAARKMLNKLKHSFNRGASQTNADKEEHPEDLTTGYENDMDISDQRNALGITNNRPGQDSHSSPVVGYHQPPPQIQSRFSPNPQLVPRSFPQHSVPSPAFGDAVHPVSNDFGEGLKRVHALQENEHSGANSPRNSCRNVESRGIVRWRRRAVESFRRRKLQLKGFFSRR